MAHSFEALSHELHQLHLRLLRREGSKYSIYRDALSLLQQNQTTIADWSDKGKAIVPFLRSTSGILSSFAHNRPEENENTVPSEGSMCLDVVHDIQSLSRQYVHSAEFRSSSVNDGAAVLRALVSLQQASSAMQRQVDSAHTSAKGPRDSDFDRVLQESYDTVLSNLRSHHTTETPTTLSVLSLLQASYHVYGGRDGSDEFESSVRDAEGGDMFSLLPVKSHKDMESRVRRCVGARDLLTLLQDMTFNRTDAGMALSTMSETGLYSPTVADKSCEELYTTHAMLSSTQVCQLIHSLGVLQHRHPHQRFFASRVDARRSSAGAVLQHVCGLAMLRQPPLGEKALVDGLFLHAMRYQPPRDGKGREGGANLERSTSRDYSREDYQLPPLWYIEAAHALACLGVEHFKFRLMTARKCRRVTRALSLPDKCRLLYGIGGVEPSSVPPALRGAWHSKVEGTVRVTEAAMKALGQDSDPLAARALQYCGLMPEQHHGEGSAPQQEQVPIAASSDTNPIETILSTGRAISPGEVLTLVECVEAAHLPQSSAAEGGVLLARLVTIVAQRCGSALGDGQGRGRQNHELYRLAPLCELLAAHAATMSSADALQSLEGLQRLSATQHFAGAAEPLVENLWSHRAELTEEQWTRVRRALQHLGGMEKAMSLMSYSLSR